MTGPMQPSTSPPRSEAQLLHTVEVAFTVVKLILLGLFCAVSPPGRFARHQVRMFLDGRTVSPRPAEPTAPPSDPFVWPSPR
jgi:hypothetical protein